MGFPGKAWWASCGAWALLAAQPAMAGADEALRADLQRLLQRVERLEQDNKQLRERLEQAEGERQATDKALATDRLSDKEPELVTRLKAVEFQTLEMQKQARQIEALEGVTVGAALTSVVQSVNAAGAGEGRAQSRANYRGDVSVSLPGGDMGDIEGKLFAHFRLGQGASLALRPTYTSTVNSTAFETAAGPDDSFAILAQAWYQLSIPLPRGGFKPHSTRRLEINVGKIDPFVFFDQNTAADDESTRFLNNVFVHNPLLDSGGDVGADAYGFAPGVRVAYLGATSKTESWGASLGVFGAGAGANFSGSLAHPFVIGQLETAQRFFSGLPGNYRLYAWSRARAADFDATPSRHTGWGFSADQRINDDWTLFGRYGQQAQGRPRFDRALTLGAETDGSAWGRGADALGLAAGLLHTGAGYREAAGAAGHERVAELYYRFHLNSRVQLTPDLQWIQRPGGERAAATVRAFALRAKVGF